MLISPDNDLALMAVLFIIAGVAFLAEKTRIGSHLTGAVIAILSAIAVANLRIIPHSAPAFDFVFSYFVPVLIPLFLFKADLRHMLFETTRMTGAFLIAAAGTVFGVIIAVTLLDLGNLAPAADIASESYVGVIVDRDTQRPVFMVSPEGGVDIEEVAAKTPEKRPAGY